MQRGEFPERAWLWLNQNGLAAEPGENVNEAIVGAPIERADLHDTQRPVVAYSGVRNSKLKGHPTRYGNGSTAEACSAAPNRAT